MKSLKNPEWLQILAPECFDYWRGRRVERVWEAEQASANTPLTGQDEDDIETMKRDFDEIYGI